MIDTISINPSTIKYNMSLTPIYVLPTFQGRVRFGAADSAPPIRRRRFGAGQFGAGHFSARTIRCSEATLFRFVARFARSRIEDSSFNRFALNGIQEIACFIVFSS